MIIQCQKCGKEREADLSKVNLETYRKQYPFCRSCGFNRLSSKGWFKKGFKPWNKNTKGLMPIPWNYKGDKVGYDALHDWVKLHRGRPTICEECGRTGLRGRFIQWANISKK